MKWIYPFKAWGHIKAMEDRLGIRLVERRTGGRNGGGAVITKEAKEFLKQFEALDREIRTIVDDRFRTGFSKEGPCATQGMRNPIRG